MAIHLETETLPRSPFVRVTPPIECFFEVHEQVAEVWEALEDAGFDLDRCSVDHTLGVWSVTDDGKVVCEYDVVFSVDGVNDREVGEKVSHILLPGEVS